MPPAVAARSIPQSDEPSPRNGESGDARVQVVFVEPNIKTVAPKHISELAGSFRISTGMAQEDIALPNLCSGGAVHFKQFYQFISFSN